MLPIKLTKINIFCRLGPVTALAPQLKDVKAEGQRLSGKLIQ